MADTESRLQAISRLLDSCRTVEAPVFAPGSWEGAHKAFTRARTLYDEGHSGTELEQRLDQAEQGARAAMERASDTRTLLSSSLEPRHRAREAKAQFLVPMEYGRAEEMLTRAARKIESGGSEGGLAEARKAEPLFDAAELSALHGTVLQRADSLLSVAAQEKADRYAPATFTLAQEHRSRAFKLVVADRRHLDDAFKEARAAEYESVHARALTRYIRELEANRASWETLLLEFEADLRRMADAAGLVPPRFDVGLSAAGDSLAEGLSTLASDLTTAGSELDQVASVLSRGLAETGEASPSQYPVELASQAAARLATLTEEKADWARMAKARQTQLAEVSQMADETAFELAQRREREEKFKAAQKLLAVSEGAVLYNDQDDVVLRLTGLSFDPGESELLPRHEKILGKVEQILKSYESHSVVVEGHTDARGSQAGNLTLSEKRAAAVKTRLLKDLGWDAAGMEARGFGDKHPVASNSTAEGRAKNRRIDIVILH